MNTDTLYSRYKRIQQFLMLLIVAVLMGVPVGADAQIQIGNGTDAMTGNVSPFADGWWNYKTHFLILASEISAAGLSSGDTINGIDFQRNAGTATNFWNSTTRDYRISMKNTTLSAFPALVADYRTAANASGFTQVYSNPTQSAPVDPNVWVNYPFSTPFVWNGDNIMIEVCSWRQGFTNTPGALGTNMGVVRTFSTYADAASECGTTNFPSLTQTSNIRPNIRLYVPIAKDLALISYAAPASTCPGTTPVSVVLRNTGTQTWNFATDTVTVTGETTGANPTTFTAVTLSSGTLAPDSTMIVTLSTNFNLTSGDHTLTTTLSSPEDGLSGNNTVVRNLSIATPVAMPYEQDFNASTVAPPGWVLNGAGINTDGGRTGNGIRRNVFGTIDLNVIAPLVGPATPISYVEFYYRITNWSGGGASVLTPPSLFALLVSGDCGTTYDTVVVLNNETHTPTTEWTRIRFPLADYAGAPVQARIIGGAFGSGIDVYFDIDDFAIKEPLPNDGSLSAVTSPAMPFAQGSQPVSVKFENVGSNAITAVQLDWSVNGVAQPRASFTGNIASFGDTTIPLGNFTFADTLHTIEVEIVSVNGGPDADPEGNEISADVRPALQGTYSVADRTELDDLLSKLAQGGAFGNVIFNVDAGVNTGTTTIDLAPFPGASAENTVTIRSATGIRTAEFVAGISPVIRFLGNAQWYKLENLTVRNTMTSLTAYGIEFTDNSRNNTVENCLVENTFTNTSTLSNPIRTNGVVRNTIIRNNTVRGGVYGIALSGFNSVNILVEGNIVEDFDLRGISFQSGADSVVIRGNEIRRPNKAVPVNSATGAVYFIWTSASGRIDNVIEQNYLHTAVNLGTNVVGGIFLSSYGGPVGNEAIVRNNLITNLQSQRDVRGIENWTNSGVYVYNNTISLTERADGDGGVYGLVMSGSSDRSDWRNNIVSITGTGSKNKVGMAMTVLTSAFPIVNNNVYHISGGTNVFVGGQISFSSTLNHTLNATNRSETIVAWRTLAAQGRETLSHSGNPALSGTMPNVTLPASSIAARSGADVKTHVPTDYNGTQRSQFFDIGAHVSPGVAFVKDGINFGNTGRELTEMVRIWNSSAVEQATVTSWANSNTVDFTATGLATFNIPANGFVDVPVRYGIFGQTRAGAAAATFNVVSSGINTQVPFSGSYARLQGTIGGENAIDETFNFGVFLPGDNPGSVTIRLSPDLQLEQVKSILVQSSAGSGDEEFFSVTNMPTTIAGEANIVAQFLPPVAGGFGRKQYTFTIVHSGQNSPTTFRFEANVGVPQIDVLSTINVNPVRAGLENYGAAYENATLVKLSKIGLVSPIVFQTPTFLGDGAMFEVLTNGTNGFILDPNVALTNAANWTGVADFNEQDDYYIAVRLRAPGTTALPGSYSQTLRIAEGNNPANSTLINDLEVQVFGIVEPADPATALVFPLRVDFGNVPRTFTGEREITLRNTTNAPMSVQLTITDQSAPFSFTANELRATTVQIPANSSRRVEVQFAPAIVGNFNASVVVSGGLNSTVQLVGVGTSYEAPVDLGTVTVRRSFANGEVLDATSQINFGTVNIGSGENELIHVVNTRNEAVTITGISRAGANPSQFLVSWEPVVIPANGSYAFIIAFGPTTPGVKMGLINVFTSQGVRSFQVRGEGVATGGTGVGGSAGRVFLQQTSMSFGNVFTGSETLISNRIVNERDNPLYVDTVLVITSTGSNGWSVPMGSGAGMIAANSDRFISVAFSNSGVTGQRNATLVVVAQGGNIIRTATLNAVALGAAGRLSSADSGIEVLGNFPNPAISETSVAYRISAPAQRVVVRLYDATGRIVGEVEQASLRAGEHNVMMNVNNLPSGGYFFIIDADGKQASAPLRIVR